MRLGFFPISYAAAGVRTHVSSVELHPDLGPLKDALPTELPLVTLSAIITVFLLAKSLGAVSRTQLHEA